MGDRGFLSLGALLTFFNNQKVKTGVPRVVRWGGEISLEKL